MMAAKLGFNTYDPVNDNAVFTALTTLLTAVETDYTLFFRGLSQFDAQGEPMPEKIPDFMLPALYQPHQVRQDYLAQLHRWLRVYALRLKKDGLSQRERQTRMNRVNPKYVLRNYLVQQAIDKAEQGDFSRINELLERVRRPYDEQQKNEKFAARRPEWARHKPGCSMLSCSS